MSRVAVVTGGTRGIGAAICEALNDAGYKVGAVFHGNEEAASAFTQRTGVPTFKFDVGDYEACKKGIARIENQLGPVEILVNNAGVARDVFLHKMKPEQWRQVISTNLDSVFNMSSLVIGRMRDRGFGRIVNISSINGQTGQIGQCNYSASKAAVLGFTKSLALESAAKGVTVNAIAPGYVDTEMMHALAPEVLEKIIAKIPVKHLGKAEDIARTVLFLVADEAGFTTGATFTVNGAQYLT